MEETTPPIRIEDLLAHRGRVRSLARALAGSGPDADDLAQEAWVRALGSPPAHRGAVGSWFRRVLGNLRRNRLRAEARRDTRERARARPESAALGRGAVERAELHRRLVDAVLALPSPSRETIVLRFFEDLAPVEIARRSGIPAATVRSRLARGLALLRERLDRDPDGRWRSLAAPTGVLVMGTKAKVAVAAMAIALIGAGAVTLGVFDSPPTAPEPAAAPDGLASAPAPETDDGEPAEIADAPAETDARPPGREFRVTVRGPDGDAVPDAVVIVLSDEGATLARARTDDGGRVTLFAEAPPAIVEAPRDVPPGATVKSVRVRDQRFPGFRLKAAKGGLVAWSPAFAVKKPEAAEVDLALVPAVFFRGRVVDEDGAPVAGAEVRFIRWFEAPVGAMETLASCVTGPDGSFHFDGMPAIPHTRLVAQAEGFLGQSVDLDRAPHRATGIEFVLSRGLSARGRCVDEAGRPLDRVLVRAPYSHVFTGRDGTFEVGKIPPREPFLRFIAKGTEEKTVTLRTSGPQPQNLADVVLTAGLAVRGVVVSGSGGPVAGARVRLQRKGEMPQAFHRDAETGEDGAFAFAELSAGEYRVSARGGPVEGSSAAALRASRTVTPGEEAVRIVLDPAGTILVSFVAGGDRTPLALEAFEGGLWRDGRPVGGRLGYSGGTCRIARVVPPEPGTYDLHVRARGYEDAVVEAVSAVADRETRVEVLLTPAR